MTKTIKSKVLISALFVALLCILISVAIALPTSAEELTPTDSGSCGENATWEYYESTGSYYNDWIADVDGSYCENDAGIFFFTPDGKYVEWTGTYLYSDIPFEISDPVIRVEE